MHSENYVQSKHADLWLSDNYLRWGVESILEHIAFGNTAMRYVFLNENQYLDVLKHNYDRGSSKIVLLTDSSLFHFLDGITFYQFPMSSSIEELQKFIISISHANEKQLQRKTPVVLTRRESVLIDLIKEGMRIAEMGEYLNLHIKTVYQIRQSLIKKMGCSGAVDLHRTLHSDVFKNWLAENHQYH
jgi:DNA-binding CsgD family transcriptional regulator